MGSAFPPPCNKNGAKPAAFFYRGWALLDVLDGRDLGLETPLVLVAQAVVHVVGGVLLEVGQGTLGHGRGIVGAIQHGERSSAESDGGFRTLLARGVLDAGGQPDGLAGPGGP